MKTDRHAQIIRLINQYEIETQEELARRLEESGFGVTQATVSRDIRELKLSKVVRRAGGKPCYALMQGTNQELSRKYIDVLRASFLSMDMAQNILVIKTASGMAMAAAAALDDLGFAEIVGSVAGDNTILCAVRTVDETLVLMEKIRRLLQ